MAKKKKEKRTNNDLQNTHIDNIIIINTKVKLSQAKIYFV